MSVLEKREVNGHVVKFGFVRSLGGITKYVVTIDGKLEAKSEVCWQAYRSYCKRVEELS